MKRVRRGAAVAGNLPSAREREKYDENEIRNKKCFGNPRGGRWGLGRGSCRKRNEEKKNERKALFCPFYREKRTFRLDWGKPAWPLQSKVGVVLQECVCGDDDDDGGAATPTPTPDAKDDDDDDDATVPKRQPKTEIGSGIDNYVRHIPQVREEDATRGEGKKYEMNVILHSN